MSIVTKVNQYLGANAHFQSYCQTDNAPVMAGLSSRQRWRMFHSQYIVACANALTEQLEPYGYVAQVETSLQIRDIDNESDVTIVYDPPPDLAYPLPVSATATASVITVPLDVALGVQDEARPNAVAVQSMRSGQSRPVAWIEILSPANKPGGRHAREYAHKRADIVNLGIPLIEIDVLHKQSPVVGGLPIYCRWDADLAQYVTNSNAYPFLISILGASLLGPDALIYPFSVDDPFPIIPIPLLETTYPFDFGIPYHVAFTQSGNYRVVDYDEMPQQMTAFTPQDLGVIRQRMATVQAYVRKFGLDKLQEGPFPALLPGHDTPTLDMEL